MSCSIPTFVAICLSSPGDGPFSFRSTICTLIRRSLNQRSALRVSAHFFVPKICTTAPFAPGPAPLDIVLHLSRTFGCGTLTRMAKTLAVMLLLGGVAAGALYAYWRQNPCL